MARYSDILTDSYGRPLAGALVTVTDTNGALASLTYDDGTPELNPVTVGEDGSYYFNLSGGLYNLSYNYGGRTVLQRNNVNIGTGVIGPVDSATIITALGYTPYNATNPQGYVSASGARAAFSAGNGIALSGGGQISTSLSLLSPIFGGNPVVTTGSTVTGPLLLTYAMTDPNAAASVGFVQSIAAGQLPKQNAVAATTANITLAGAQTIDTVAVAAGQVVLVKNQSIPAQNGLYNVATGSWNRTTDMDTWLEVPGASTLVLGGSQANSGWTCNSPPGGTLGTTDIMFVATSKPGSISGTGAVQTTGTLISLTPAAQGTVLGATATGGTVAPSAQTIPAVLGYTPANTASPALTGTIQLGDAASTVAISGGTLFQAWDTNDYFAFVRGTNAGSWFINSSPVAGFSSSGLTSLGSPVATTATLGTDTGANLIKYKRGYTGAVSLSQGQRIATVALTPEDFGAVGDWDCAAKTGTDDTAALQAWLTALSQYAQGAVSKAIGRVPAKFYRYTANLTINASGYSIEGAGSGTSGFVYDGGSTAIDTFTMGQNGGANINVHISGIRFCCNKTMTAGALWRPRGLVNSSLYDVVVQGPDHSYYANGNAYDCVWFDGAGYIETDAFFVNGASHDNLIVSAHTGNTGNNGYPFTGMFLGQGKIGGGISTGIRIAGGFGGFVNFGTDVVGNGVNTQIDSSKYARHNEQVFLLCTDDSSTVGPNILLDEPSDGSNVGTLVVKTWSGTPATHGIHIKSAPNWQVQIAGANIQNVLNGDGIRVDDVSAYVDMGDITFGNIPNGYAINPNVSLHKCSIGFNHFGPNVPAFVNFTYGNGSGRKAMAYAADASDMHAYKLSWRVNASDVPLANGDMIFQYISDTNVKLMLKGLDGTIRSANLTFS